MPPFSLRSERRPTLAARLESPPCPGLCPHAPPGFQCFSACPPFSAHSSSGLRFSHHSPVLRHPRHQVCPDSDAPTIGLPPPHRDSNTPVGARPPPRPDADQPVSSMASIWSRTPPCKRVVPYSDFELLRVLRVLTNFDRNGKQFIKKFSVIAGLPSCPATIFHNCSQHPSHILLAATIFRNCSQRLTLVMFCQ
jgi:hypothetical protein